MNDCTKRKEVFKINNCLPQTPKCIGQMQNTNSPARAEQPETGNHGSIWHKI